MYKFFKSLFSFSTPDAKKKEAILATLLKLVYKNELPLRLLLPGYELKTESLHCTITRLSKKMLILETAKAFLPDVLNNEVCNLYLKIPLDRMPSDLRYLQQSGGTGFLCSCRVIKNDVNTKRATGRLFIVPPTSFIQQELRRYERARPPLKYIPAMGMWTRFMHLPATREQLGKPDFFYRDPGIKQISLVDISAGGAQLDLKDIEPDADISLYTSRLLVFLITLTQVAKKECLTVLVGAKCLEATHNSLFNTVNMRLCFTHLGRTEKGSDGIDWFYLKDGVPALSTWVERDYMMYTSQKAKKNGVL